MTAKELKDALAAREEINRQLALLIEDEDALMQAIDALEGRTIKMMQITLNNTNGEAMSAYLMDIVGNKLNFKSNSDGSGMLNAMIAAGLAHAQEAINTRKAELIAQL